MTENHGINTVILIIIGKVSLKTDRVNFMDQPDGWKQKKKCQYTLKTKLKVTKEEIYFCLKIRLIISHIWFIKPTRKNILKENTWYTFNQKNKYFNQATHTKTRVQTRD